MERDFPAAHSMDTHWFAVDRDGHVASFQSGEAGAVPRVALAIDAYAVYPEMARLLPEDTAIYDIEGDRMPRQPEIGHWEPQQQTPRPLILFVESLESLRDEIASHRATVVSSTQGSAVIWHEPSIEQWQRIHEYGDCKGCARYYSAFESLSGFAPSRHGLFTYTHLTENWVSGPYGRRSIPEHPIHIDQLPPHLRDGFKMALFPNLIFSETAHLQPVEHVACDSWEAAYMDVDGYTIRPIPGREEDYDYAYTILQDYEDEYYVEPPEPSPDED